jgi:hypothetical protein
MDVAVWLVTSNRNSPHAHDAGNSKGAEAHVPAMVSEPPLGSGAGGGAELSVVGATIERDRSKPQAAVASTRRTSAPKKYRRCISIRADPTGVTITKAFFDIRCCLSSNEIHPEL